MNCRDFEHRLEAWLDGRLASAERPAFRRHARSCGACRELLEIAGPPEVEAQSPPPGLLTTVLERTTGSACAQARERLGDFVDGELAAVDRQLVASHLEACGDCRRLTEVLRALARELPTLAEAPIDPRFVPDVMAATLPIGIRMRRRWAERWRRWAHRPRFAWEAAYVGLLVIVLTFGTPGSPLAAVPRSALELTRVEPREHLASTIEAVEEALRPVTTTLLQVEAPPVPAGLRRLASAAWAHTRSLWEWTRDELGTLWERFASLLARADGQDAPSQPTEPTEDDP